MPAIADSLFDFDPKEVAAAALNFTSAVRYAGWICEPDKLPDPVDGQPAQASDLLVEPLIKFEAALNPDRLVFSDLDAMKWLLELEPNQVGFCGGNEVNAVTILTASLGWVIRFWQAEDLCITGTWEVHWPFKNLPLSLVESIEDTAKMIRDDRQKLVQDRSFPKKVIPSEAFNFARRAMLKVRDIRKNLEQNAEPNIDADYELFNLWDDFNWSVGHIPFEGFEPVFTNAFCDGGICGTTAHTALHNLNYGLRLGLGGLASKSRGEVTEGREPLPHLIPFWLPETRWDMSRELAAGAVPNLNAPLWGAQLEIEQSKLVRLARSNG